MLDNAAIDENEIHSGKVVHFKSKDGYGFIRPEAELPDVYVHYTEIDKGKKGYKNLLQGDIVTFKIKIFESDSGERKLRAVDLNIVRSIGAG